MSFVTEQQLADAAIDLQALSDFINGSATFDTDGIFTTRLGGSLKTLAKLSADIQATLDPSGFQTALDTKLEASDLSTALAAYSTTSAIDTKISGTVKVPVLLTNDADLDTYVAVGVTHWTDASVPTNSPVADQAGLMIVSQSATDEPVIQTVILSDNSIRVRSKASPSASWSDFNHILGSDDKATDTDVDTATDDRRYVTSVKLKRGILAHLPDRARAVDLVTDLQAGGGGYRSGGAIMSDKTLRVWGNNSALALGIGSTTSQMHQATAVVFDTQLKLTPKNWVRNYRTSYVLMETGEVFTWGQGADGQTGQGNTSDQGVAKQVSSLSGVSIEAVYTGQYQTSGSGTAVFKTSSGSAYTVGYNGYGQLGDGTTISKSTPVLLSKTDWASFFVAGSYYTAVFGIDTSGSLWTWGYNSLGRLGVGDTTNRSTPTHVNAFGGVGVSKVHGGISGPNAYGHTVALLANGKVYAWGYNNYGQLGLGNLTNFDTPQEITALGTDNVDIVTVGGQYGVTYVQKTDGRILACGYNAYGQLGDGTTTSKSSFVQARASRQSISPIRQLCPVGHATTSGLAVLDEDGLIEFVGYNSNGNAGIGNGSASTTMSRVLTNPHHKPVKLAVAGIDAACALIILTEGGQVYQTGISTDGQRPGSITGTFTVPVLLNLN